MKTQHINTALNLESIRGEVAERELLITKVSTGLEEIVDSMFLENLEQDGYHEVNTFAVLIAYDGEIVTEQYEKNHNPNMRILSWSMAKTVTGLLAGILYDQGKLDPNEMVSALSDHGKAATIAQVMNMSIIRKIYFINWESITLSSNMMKVVIF